MFYDTIHNDDLYTSSGLPRDMVGISTLLPSLGGRNQTPSSEKSVTFSYA